MPAQAEPAQADSAQAETGARLARSRPHTAIAGLLTAEAIAVTGTRMSFFAIPWLVLVTTNDPIKVGIVTGAEMLPYVLSGLFSAPLQDRLGHRRASIYADLLSVVLVGLVAIASQIDFVLLTGLVALAGAVRALGDRAKNNMLKPLMDAGGIEYSRITAAYDGIMRTANLVGASVAGVAIAWLGAVGAIWLNAAAFAVCAGVVIVVVRDPSVLRAPPAQADEPYLQALRTGLRHFRSDRLFVSMTTLLAITNMFAQAIGVVFIPLWVLNVLGSPVALGFVLAAFALGAVVGNIAFAALAPHLPRYPVMVIGFIVGGAPRFVVLALTDSLVVVIAVTFVGGLTFASVNPTIGALIYHRLPLPMLARVGGIMAAVAYGGMPLGGLVGGLAVSWFGFTNGIMLTSAICLIVSLIPVVRRDIWREVDDAGQKRTIGDISTLPLGYALIHSSGGLRTRLTYQHGRWRLYARNGLRSLIHAREVEPKTALDSLAQLSVPQARAALRDLLAGHRDRVARQAEQLHRRMASIRGMLTDLDMRKQDQ